MSLTVAQVIQYVEGKHPGVWTAPQIATTLALICGIIVIGIGLLRIGWLVEFIPAPAVSGFMTGSAISIAAGQVPGLMGITGFEYVPLEVHTSTHADRLRSKHPCGHVQSNHQHT
jgi:sodium-independent sulfate anion transporter 11